MLMETSLGIMQTVNVVEGGRGGGENRAPKYFLKISGVELYCQHLKIKLVL